MVGWGNNWRPWRPYPSLLAAEDSFPDPLTGQSAQVGSPLRILGPEAESEETRSKAFRSTKALAKLVNMEDEVEPLLQAIRTGQREALNQLLLQHRDAVRAAVALRMDDHLRARVDESDIVQEASLIVARRIADFLERRPMTFRLWFRQTALECLLQARRKHLVSHRRAVGREVSIDAHSAIVLAERLLGPPTPSNAAMAQERAEQVRQAVEDLSDVDRDVVLLRCFEGLTNAETATVLELHPDASSKRFARALLHLRDRFVALGLSG